MKSFLLASGNAHKAEEFKELFVDVLNVTPSPRTLEIEETGKTFIENALIKAKAYYDTYKVPSLADDSGLVVEALPDLLGVKSARFAPELPDYADKSRKLIEMLGHGQKSRKAYFVCVLCFYLSADEIFFFEGRVHGEIGQKLKGEKGFGYDPVFIPERKENDGLSLAELPEWKNQFSHRAKASLAAIDFFKSLKKA